MPFIKPIYLLLACFLLLPSFSSAGSLGNWQVVKDYDVLTGSRGCLIESMEKQTHDGHGMTGIKLLYNGRVFIADTDSNIDMNYPNLGLSVDNGVDLSIDEIKKEKVAVFSEQAEKIKKLFIKGNRVTLTLGFWPTWPKTQAVTTEFSLIGFTKTYQEFLHCQQAFQG